MTLARTDARAGRLPADPADLDDRHATTRRRRPPTRPRVTTSRATTSPTAPAARATSRRSSPSSASPTARSTTTARASSCSPRSYGTLRSTNWAQLPMLQAALDDAEDRTRRSRTSWSSPTTRWTTRPRPTPRSSATATRSRWSRSCCRTSARTSDKGVAMVGSHAQIADVHRIEGVPYTVLPVVGQGPVRHAGPRRLHRLAGLACRQGRDRGAAVADGRRPRVRAVDHAGRAGGARGGRLRAARRLDRPAVGRHERHAGRAAALPDVGPLERLGRRWRSAPTSPPPRPPARSRSSTRRRAS